MAHLESEGRQMASYFLQLKYIILWVEFIVHIFASISVVVLTLLYEMNVFLESYLLSRIH